MTAVRFAVRLPFGCRLVPSDRAAGAAVRPPYVVGGRLHGTAAGRTARQNCTADTDIETPATHTTNRATGRPNAIDHETSDDRLRETHRTVPAGIGGIRSIRSSCASRGTRRTARGRNGDHAAHACRGTAPAGAGHSVGAAGGLAGPDRQILGTCGSRPPCPHPNQTGRGKGERRMAMRCARTIGRPHPPTGSWGRSVQDRALTSLAINRDFSESFMRARVPLGEPDPFRRWPARCTGDESPGVTRGPTDRNGPPDAPGSPLRRPFASGWVHLPTPALQAFRGRFSQTAGFGDS